MTELASTWPRSSPAILKIPLRSSTSGSTRLPTNISRETRTPTESAGHLPLHLTGNLNYYIGAQIAATGYVRDRDREFTESGSTSQERGRVQP
jgi:hypothetical protein